MRDITDPANRQAIALSPNFTAALDDLLTFWAYENRPYSSGELAAAIREHRPDLSFSVPTLGGILRERFYQNTLPSYSDDGDGNGPCQPLQRGRFTTGKYRTRAGVEVFVYGPNADACDAHEFEVWIPQWNATLGRMMTMADAPVPTVTAPSADSAPGTAHHTQAQAQFQQVVANNIAKDTATVKARTLVSGAKPAGVDFVASVWPDRRMAVGRGAFEALCHLSGKSIRAGDQVHVTVKLGDEVTVTLEPTPDSRPLSLVATKGNVAFASGDRSHPFVPGTFYPITITPDAITVNLTKAL